MATQKRFIAKNGLDNNSNTITNVSDPSGLQDAATKNYVSSNFVGASSSAYPTISPTLNLDFVGTRQLDSRITFTRNSIATYYDGQTSALAEQNLLTYSQDFTNAVWNNTANVTVVADNATSPDGTLTADTLTFTGISYKSQNVTTGTVTGKTYTFSVWVSSATGKDTIGIRLSGLATGTDHSFLLVTLTSTPTRYSVTRTFTSTDSSVTAGLDNRTSIVGGLQTTGDVIVWGAQLEQRSAVTAYTPTTTDPITNYIPQLMTAAANIARLDYSPTTGQPLGLLIEESRTNLATYSSDFSNAGWAKTSATVTADTIIAPDGTLTGDTFTTTTTSHAIRQVITVTASTSYTFSWYAKLSTLTPKYSVYNATGSADIIAQSLYPTGTSVGNGWFRYSVTFTTPVGCVTAGIYPVRASGTTGDIYLWGAQLEVGSFLTSYIPTVASTVTRVGDFATLTGTNFSSWYNQSQGTVCVNYDFNFSSLISNYGVYSLNNGASSSRLDLRTTTANNSSNATSLNAPTVSGNLANGALNKAASSYIVTASTLTINGTNTSSYSLSVMPAVTQLQIGGIDGGYVNNINGHIRKLSYYPIALSASNLVALTS